MVEHGADAIAPLIRDVQIRGRINRRAELEADFGVDGWPAVSREPGSSIADHRVDVLRDRVHPAHTVVAEIADEIIAENIHCHAHRIVQHGGRCRLSIAAEPWRARAVAGNGVDGSHSKSRRRCAGCGGGEAIHLPHRVIAAVHDVEIAVGVVLDLFRKIQRCLCG